jgi:hypothetical protein
MKPACPLCHRNTAVNRIALLHYTTSYQNDPRFAPPVQPAEQSFLFWPISLGVVIETLTLIIVILLCASGNFNFGQYWLAVAGICLPLILSVYAFRRMLNAEKHDQKQFAWDEAMASWNRACYCATDHTVFDPSMQTNEATLSTVTQAPHPTVTELEPVGATASRAA